MANSPWWLCASCGFRNQPRHVANSLGSLPPGHQIFDPEWRHSHCEQCGQEYRDDIDQEYQPK